MFSFRTIMTVGITSPHRMTWSEMMIKRWNSPSVKKRIVTKPRQPLIVIKTRVNLTPQTSGPVRLCSSRSQFLCWGCWKSLRWLGLGASPGTGLCLDLDSSGWPGSWILGLAGASCSCGCKLCWCWGLWTWGLTRQENNFEIRNIRMTFWSAATTWVCRRNLSNSILNWVKKTTIRVGGITIDMEI